MDRSARGGRESSIPWAWAGDGELAAVAMTETAANRMTASRNLVATAGVPYRYGLRQDMAMDSA